MFYGMVCGLFCLKRSQQFLIFYPKTETMSIQIQATKTQELRSKILELQSALFFTDSTSLIKLPTHIISEVEMDEEGMIWFVIPRPSQDIRAFDKEIATRMEFFKKGKEFFVKVSGKASLITEEAEAAEVPGLSETMLAKMADQKLIAVRVEIKESELVDNAAKANRTWLQISRSQLSSWFF
jgi:hypothetical protein